MRTDSGCDIGMLYHDEGCDCHPQLLKALEETKKSGGIIVHIPTQDGRGYGMNTKIVTEAHKNGIPTVLSQSTEPKGTLTVARELFGDGHHDIRTYYGVAVMLQELGFRIIDLITDNVNKIRQMQSVPELTVNPVKTDTINRIMASGGNEKLIRHLEEKHGSPDYIS